MSTRRGLGFFVALILLSFLLIPYGFTAAVRKKASFSRTSVLVEHLSPRLSLQHEESLEKKRPPAERLAFADMSFNGSADCRHLPTKLLNLLGFPTCSEFNDAVTGRLSPLLPQITSNLSAVVPFFLSRIPALDAADLRLLLPAPPLPTSLAEQQHPEAVTSPVKDSRRAIITFFEFSPERPSSFYTLLALLMSWRVTHVYSDGTTKYPFVVTSLTPLPDEVTKALTRVFPIRFVVVPDWGFNRNSNKRPRWNVAMNKLSVFGLTVYEKVVMVDTDTLILRNIEDMFDLPDISGVHDFSTGCSGAGFNSGVLVVEPDSMRLQAVIAYRNFSSSCRNGKDFDHGDQELFMCLTNPRYLQSTPRRFYLGNMTMLPYYYNAAVTSCDCHDDRSEESHGSQTSSTRGSGSPPSHSSKIGSGAPPSPHSSKSASGESPSSDSSKRASGEWPSPDSSKSASGALRSLVRPSGLANPAVGTKDKSPGPSEPIGPRDATAGSMKRAVKATDPRRKTSSRIRPIQRKHKISDTSASESLPNQKGALGQTSTSSSAAHSDSDRMRWRQSDVRVAHFYCAHPWDLLSDWLKNDDRLPECKKVNALLWHHYLALAVKLIGRDPDELIAVWSDQKRPVSGPAHEGI